MIDLAFHHFGLAVKSPVEATLFLSALGYKMGEPLFDPGQNVRLMMATHTTQPAIEIIFEGQAGGPIDKMIQQRPQGIVYHICYTTSNLSASLAQLKAQGVRAMCISSPKPAPLFGGRRVSFYQLTGAGLIEILESNE